MPERRLRAVRGATTLTRDDPDELRAVTRELLEALLARNALQPDDVVSAFFTLTSDLRSAFPARAARDLGWADVPLLCATAVPVAGALPRCVRVLLHVETTRARDQLSHVYLRGAANLRPDLA